ncbi:MAG: mechanosensitive ion channel [Opitutae bacterium]|nr:mechanosensitive ion channel [Opitutae bacterium]
MNSTSVFHFAEGTALVLVLLAALGIAALPRRILAQKARAARGKGTQWLLAALESLLFPLLAMGLGWGVLWAPEALPVSWAGLVPPAHRSAWHLFWLAMLVYNFAEATWLQILSWGGKPAIPALLRGVLRVVVTALAGFAVLRFELGFNITPLLASTALVTAVVGFALQGVLGNLLAGMSLNLTGSLAHRDWVAIDDLEGRVEEMNWRETWLVTLENIPVRIPNSKVADARIRHLSRPAESRRCSLFVDASYDAAPDAVIAALLGAAKAVPQVCRTPEPAAFVLDYKSYGVGYELRIWLDDYPRRNPILGEVRRHVWYQFRRAGIEIPYPVTDQVLNDFMARAVAPASPAAEDAEARRRAAGLLQSDFARTVLQGADGKLMVPAEELAAWAGRLPSQLYGCGETLFRQGDAGDCCFVVLSGSLMGRIRHRESGKETTFEVGAGAVVGEMSLMTGLPRMAEIQVTDTAELLRIPAPQFAELIGQHAGVVEQLSQLVSERAQQNRKQVEDLLAAGAPSMEQAISRDGILKRFWRLLGG